ncbi:MAG: tRNA lysidine(34) synthetase TilS, partial [bacterium]
MKNFVGIDHGDSKGDLYPRFREFCRRHKLIETGDRIVVAVSGGGDSMALAHLLLRLSQEWELKLRVAHFNHKLRPEADNEEEMVKAWCEKVGIEVIIGAVEDPQTLWQFKRGVHAACRKERYRFLVEVAKNWDREKGEPLVAYKVTTKRWNDIKVATGHQQDDQVETVLLRIATGAPPDSWGGIGVKGTLPGYPYLMLIRPLLGFRRSELENYCHQFHIPYAQDSTNRDFRYPRARIRALLLPVWEEVWGVKGWEGLLRSAEWARLTGEEIRRRTFKALRSTLVRCLNGEIVLDYPTYVSYFSIVRINILQEALHIVAQSLGVENSRTSYSRLWEADAHILESGRGIIPLGERYEVECWKRWIYIYKRHDSQYQYIVKGNGYIKLPYGVSIRLEQVKLLEEKDLFVHNKNLIFSLSERVEMDKIFVRGAKPGDRIWALGADYPLSVFDLLRAEGVPPHRREGYPVIEVGGEIAVLPPFRIAQSFKVNLPLESRKAIALK